MGCTHLPLKLQVHVDFYKILSICIHALNNFLFHKFNSCLGKSSFIFFVFYADRESPCHVKLLRSQKVVYISCGEEHTAVLTKVKPLPWELWLLSHLPNGFTLVSWEMGGKNRLAYYFP